jgi:signal transduction histidine kinase
MRPIRRSRWRRHVNAADMLRIERLLSVGRLVLALASLVAVYIDAPEPARFRAFCYSLLIAYTVIAAVVFALLHTRAVPVRSIVLWLHVLDIVWATALTIITTGPSSPFFVLFTFVVVSAAYRWGLNATIATALMTVGLLLVESAVFAGSRTLEIPLEINRLLIRCTYLLLVSVFVGVLAEREHRQRSESSMLAQVLADAQAPRGLASTLGGIAREVLDSFEMSTALVALRERVTGRTFLWHIRAPEGTDSYGADVSELPRESRDAYFFEVAEQADVCHVSRSGPDKRLRSLAVDDAGHRLKGFSVTIPDAFSSRHRWGSLLCAKVTAGDEWTGRLMLLDPLPHRLREPNLAFLRTICSHASPALYSVYLNRRLRARVGAIERARIARELHDGVIQSLFSMQLQLETARRRSESESHSWIPPTIDHLQEQLRQEMLNLRDLMRDLQPPDASSGRILELISERVEKFASETGVTARVISELGDVQLPSRLCQELLRIVQEALVNIRKHSGASNVVLWFEAREGFWRIVVDDDGQGFGFEGRLTLEDLEAQRRGPIVIRDRVKAMGGSLVIDSRQGQGSRLEVLIPQGETNMNR